MRKWKTKDGNKISIKDMETSHIENALAMLKRKRFIDPSTLAFYLFCTPPNGDMAILAFDQECEAIFEAPTSQFVGWFEKELKRRINGIHQ